MKLPPPKSVAVSKTVLASLVQTKIAVLATPRSPSRTEVSPPALDAGAAVVTQSDASEPMDTGAASGSDITDAAGHDLSQPDSGEEQPAGDGEVEEEKDRAKEGEVEK